MPSQLKIAYVTTFNSSNINIWSGIGYHIGYSLSNTGAHIQKIGKLRTETVLPHLAKKLFYSIFQGKKYLSSREPAIQRYYARQVEKQLRKYDVDVILCAGTSPIAYHKTNTPIITWIDSTFDQLIDFYPEYTNICTETLRKAKITTQAALDNSRYVIFSSEWAAENVLRNYAIESDKVKVIPFGANLAGSFNLQDIEIMIRNKNLDTCRLLFVGKDWQRKRGDFAVKVAELLNQRGVKTELHIAGCPLKNNIPDFVIQHGVISKEKKEGIEELESLYTESHFFILPTTAETYGIVLAESSSFGLPALTTRIGGIPTIIVDGKNGQTFDLADGPEKYSEYIERIFSAKVLYNQLALSTYKEYMERLNWDVSGRKVITLIHEILSHDSKPQVYISKA